ncbi:MAG: flavodoxin domain-containing protein [Proteobacteria bacterium]|nr:flavodoxin domain-containing protein [Pseudomonadota bacterium]
MKPVKVVDDIYWVGAIDWNVRDFHGYATYQGSTYNAYLVMDEKITLVDTVKKEFVDEMLARISQVVDPKKIDCVISNHTEMDHSGGLPRMMHRIGEEKPLYCSKVGHRNLSSHFKEAWNYQPVENGGTLSLGKRTLNFLETRMLHWPDSMFSYCPEDRLLFASDAFGQHYAGLERFDDEIGEAILPHAKKYYANILLPYSALVLKLVDKVTEMGLALDVVCPDHGIIWRKDPGLIIGKYVEWARQAPRRKAVVVFDTMWHSTEKMAGVIAEALGRAGVETRLMHLRSWHRSEVITEIQDAGAVLVGSPTLNNGLFPTVADFLCYMKGLKPQNKVAAAFGSHGWSGEAVKLINAEFEAMKLNVVHPGVKSAFVPDDQVLEACVDLARQVAEALPA